MASYKMNIARIKGCPGPKRVGELMTKFGLPATEEYGVLTHQATDATLFATIVRKTQQTVQRLSAETNELTSDVVERVTVYPFGVKPDTEQLEVYAGSAAAIEQVGAFLSNCLALPVVVEAIEIDVADALDKLAKHTKNLQLRSIRVSEYAHNSFMIGPYTPKFLDSEHGKEFMEQYADFITTASVRFAGSKGKVTASLSTKACFGFSCHEDDVSVVKSILRKLV